MPDPYHQLLDATMDHLRGRQRLGVRFVPVTPETIEALRKPVPRAAPPAVPARPAPSAGEALSPSAARPPTPARTRAPLPAWMTAVQAPPPAAPRGGAPAPPPSPAPAPAPAPVASEFSLGLPGQQTVPAAEELSAAARAAAFAALRERVLACAKCAHLAASRQHVVFGVGNPDAQLMFVGEAPGADEDAQGEPFVGRAGELLTRMIHAMGLKRSDVYIANILKCRPDTPGQSSGNRPPRADEMATCIPYLREQIALIRPRVLVALGATAMGGLFGRAMPITRLRGQWQTYRGLPLMPTYHPAYLLRNQSLAEKRKVWEDMLLVMEKLGLPITEKQRGFFLRAMGGT